MSASHQDPDTSYLQRLNGVRIARISTVPFYVVAQLKNQLSFLGSLGAEVTVVASDEPEFADLEGIRGLRCHAIDIPRAISPRRDFQALILLWRFFVKHRIQIAHSTTPKAGLLTAVAAFLARVPIRLHTYTGQPWVTLKGVKRVLARGSDLMIGSLNTRCYTDSPGQKKFLVEQGIIDPGRIFVFGSGSLAGVDTQRFARSRFALSDCNALKSALGIPDGVPILLFVGRITVDKGIRELLAAFRDLTASGSRAHLILVGDFDSDSGMGNSVSPRDLSDIAGVHVVDYSNTPEAYMAIADVLCLPSYREGFGTVVIEAAALGVPTIGTNIYGLSDAVIDGETGMLVPPRDALALASAIKTMLNDPNLRERFGRAARQRVLDLFDSEKFNQKIAAEYDLLLRAAGIVNPARKPSSNEPHANA